MNSIQFVACTIDRMVIAILILSKLFVLSAASCPFLMNAYNEAIIQQKLQLKLKNNLIDNGFVVTKGQPGFDNWTADNLTHIDLLHKADILYRTEQIYSELNLTKNGGPSILSIKEKLKAMSLMSDCVNLENRCQLLNHSSINRKDYIYRTIDGTFNNLQNPLYGSSYTPFGELLSPMYDDGVNTMRMNALNGAELPSPRTVGNAILKDNDHPISPKQILSAFGLYFGQSAGAHDLSKVMKTGPKKSATFPTCCSKDYTKILPKNLQTESCAPISIPKNDPYYSAYNMTCETFLRTFKTFRQDCKLGSAQKMNRETSFLDLSSLYGPANEDDKVERTFQGGKLKTNKENVLPEKPNPNEFTYLLGDRRAAVSPILVGVQSLLVRLHNTMAGELATLNPKWNDEIIFQETRRINIALYQHIFYTEFLPIILDEKILLEKGLICEKQANKTYCGKYNPHIISNCLSEYGEGVFRLLHANVPETMDLYDADFKKYKFLNTDDLIHNVIVLQTDYNGALRGSFIQPIKLNGYNQQIRTTAFKNFNKLGVGIDISSLDIQRGRDHGQPPYHKYMEHCQPHLGKILNWNDLKHNIRKKDIDILKGVYDSVFDVDLYIGLYLERKSEYFGPVGICIMVEQFYRTKFGDRFFYSFQRGHNPFTEKQLKEIQNYSTAQLLCQQTNMTTVTKNPLIIPSKENSFISCTNFKKFDLTLWQKDYLTSTSSESSAIQDLFNVTVHLHRLEIKDHVRQFFVNNLQN